MQGQVISCGIKRGVRVLVLSLSLCGVPLIASADTIQYGPVSSSDTVYSIATNFRPGGVEGPNIRQWILAIYALNPEAFNGGFETLKLGSRLSIPESAEQVELLWRDGQQRLLAAAAGTDSQGVTSAPPSPGTKVAVPQPSLATAGESVPGGNAAAADEPSEVPVALPGPAAVNSPPPPSGNTGSVVSADSDTNPATRNSDELLALSPEGAVAAGPFRGAPLFERARQAVANNNASAVLAALDAAEADYSGDPDFDYLYGVVLLDSGQPERALFPLLRTSQQQPGSLGVRLDLGRAYFETGENESARRVFSELAVQNPPPRAAEVIRSYLDAIERRAARYESRLAGLVSLESGYDSNANSATDALVFQGFMLDERSRSTESPYAGLTGNLEYSRPLSPRFRWFGSGRANTRQFSDADELSTVHFGLGTGLGYRRGDWQTSLRFNASQLLVDGEENNDYVSASLGWAHSGASFWTWRAQAQYGQVRYDEVSIRDVDQVLLALGATRRLNWIYGAELGMDLIGGVDEAVEDGSPNGRDIVGVSLSGILQFTPRWQASLSSHYLLAEYDGLFVSGLEREDQQLSTEIAVSFSDNRWRNWSLRAGALFVDNSSDVELFDYDRLDATLSLRRLFN